MFREGVISFAKPGIAEADPCRRFNSRLRLWLGRAAEIASSSVNYPVFVFNGITWATARNTS
jgi:hypothetical protein